MFNMKTTVLAILAVTASTATPLRSRASPDPIQQIITVAPTSSSCTGATYPSECATASDALGPTLAGFAQYQVHTAQEQAALLSWMAYESDDFKYNMNHFPAPGTPGQGTRCMMSPTYVKEYVASLPELANNASTASGPAAILALVEGNDYSFAAASWFYSTQCSDEIKAGLQTGGDAGWETFTSTCVGASLSGTGRQEYWDRAKTALGI